MWETGTGGRMNLLEPLTIPGISLCAHGLNNPERQKYARQDDGVRFLTIITGEDMDAFFLPG
jgi:hypothetical protein